MKIPERAEKILVWTVLVVVGLAGSIAINYFCWKLIGRWMGWG